MELLYLLFSAISTLFTSLILSLILPFRLLLRHHLFSYSVTAVDEPVVTLYEGVVWHERRRPVHHSFSYRVRYALFDLDNASTAPRDHFSAVDARRVAGTTGPVSLLTIPPSVGYEQNPLSLYYCYDVQDSTKILKKCIAEVTNTPWGERVSFVFDPKSDMVAKALHVSPFMDMLGHWIIKTNSPADSLYVTIKLQHPELGDHFTATLSAKRVPGSDDQALYFWLMPHKVALWIYWHALKLWWKGVPFVQHPRYANPAYREEAAVRDDELINHCRKDKVEVNGSCFVNDRNVPAACRFAWRDAKWPWC